jgi:ribosome biogenesis GTPase
LEPVHISQLEELGWNQWFAERLAALGDPSFMPARVVADYGALVGVQASAQGATRRVLGPALRSTGKLVAVGDWVALRPSGPRRAIAAVLERRSALSRKVPQGESREQVVAANVDTVLLTMSLGGDFNVRRLERLLTVVYQSGAAPAVLLTKSDVFPADAALRAVAASAPGVPVHVLSPLTGQGVPAVARHLARGSTGVLLGSSGAGKSTLLNRLLGADQQVIRDVHRSGQGRHTTSHRELFLLPGGGVVIDTPGLREIQLWTGGGGLEQVFGDIEDVAAQCRFSNCGHGGEPGCAIAAALTAGALDPGRWASYAKLQRELRSIEVRADARMRSEERSRWKRIHRDARERMAAKGR